MYKYDRKGPKRGVALYSYSAEFGLTKTLEDCFEDVHDMGAHGIEILANTHIENYPYPTDEWVEKWWRLCDKYEIVPVEYGNWIDSHVLGDRDLTTEESVEMLKRDIRLAHRLGFTVMRTKMPVINGLWCATRQEDSEILKSFVPPVEQLAGGFFTPLHSSSHGIQQEPSSEVSAEYVSCCSSGYKSLLR